jgi:hypothetical protein
VGVFFPCFGCAKSSSTADDRPLRSDNRRYTELCFQELDFTGVLGETVSELQTVSVGSSRPSEPLHVSGDTDV